MEVLDYISIDNDILISAVAFQRKQSLSKRRLRRTEMRYSSTVSPKVMTRTGGRCIGYG